MTIGRRVMPLTILASLLAFVIGQLSFALAPWQPQLWPAGLSLVVLGGITPLIYAVNLRVLPLFSGRAWRSPGLLYTTIAISESAWLAFAGRAFDLRALEIAGDAGCLLAGLLFVASVTMLGHSSRSGSAPPRVSPRHAAGDHAGRLFTRIAGLYLLFGLAVGLLLPLWRPEVGRWQLVWAHALLVGWFLSMASGISYHVLPRWSRHDWRHPRLLRLHVLLVAGGLPFMLLALSVNAVPLFAVAGPLEAAALIIFVWNILPLARDLPSLTRWGLTAAGAFLALGVSLGALMAAAPAWQPRLHQTHAEINLFGWSGLLVAAFGYYLFPRLAGRPLRWPRLAAIQLPSQGSGVLLSAIGWWWFGSGADVAKLVVAAGSFLAALALLALGVIIGATFLSQGTPAGASPRLVKRTAAAGTA